MSSNPLDNLPRWAPNSLPIPKPTKRSRTEAAEKRRAEDAAMVAEVKQKAKRKAIKPRARWAFYAEWKFTCQYCGTKAGEKDADGDTCELAIDHKVSIDDGGPDTADNWVCSCAKCNAAKGRMSVRD